LKRVVTRIVAIVLATMAAIYPGLPVSAQAARAHSQKATVVLVHGEFAESASWNGVIDRLGSALAAPVALPGGGNDLYIQQDKFRAQFAADVRPARQG
jgi:hypothetical protein